MSAHPVPIYLGCAGLIVGTLGLGAHHLVGGNNLATTVHEQPLFAKSVEEAALPAPRWPHQTQEGGVAFHEPMVELLTTGASPEAAQAAATREEANTSQPATVREIPLPSAREATAREPTAATASAPVPPRVQGEAGVPAPREIAREAPRQEAVRDVPRQQVEQPRKRNKNTRRAKADLENPDQRSMTPDQRSTTDRRRRASEDRRHPEQRVIVREVIREPEPRIVRVPEQGFSPFRLFGIFDHH